MIWAALAATAVFIHLLWILWVMFGALLTRRRAWLACLHILSLAYGIAISVGPWPCPLTVLEQELRARAGRTPYRQSFLAHYLEALVYPDVPEGLLTWASVLICALNLGVYGIRWRQAAVRGHKKT